jgi:ubiquinone/menaquinone biosynthesis C-methylase UbiE
MGWWRDQVVPRLIDRSRGPAADRLRAQACVGLVGEVVELGFGSGLSVPHYPSTVRSVAAIEPSDVAWRMAQRRIAAGPIPVSRPGRDATMLPLPDGSVDCALSTFSMCSLPDLDAALSEVARVLYPGGSLHFVEHGRSCDPRVARWQDRLQPLNGRLAGGCHLNRPLADYLRRSPLLVDELDTVQIEGPRAFTFIYRGRAHRAS